MCPDAPSSPSTHGRVEVLCTHVKLDRAQKAEVRLAAMSLVEAETRCRAAAESLARAKDDIVMAQRTAENVHNSILDELDLSPDNVIDVESLVVLPPSGENYVKANE